MSFFADFNPLWFCFKPRNITHSTFWLFQEEQNASSSANYDVELLHPVEAHEEMLKSGKNVDQSIESEN